MSWLLRYIFLLLLLSPPVCSQHQSLGEPFKNLASLVGQRVKNLPAMQDTWILFLGLADPLEKGMATYSSVFVRRIPWTEELGGLQSVESQSQTWLSNFQFLFKTWVGTCIPSSKTLLWHDWCVVNAVEIPEVNLCWSLTTKPSLCWSMLPVLISSWPQSLIVTTILYVRKLS